jgi:pyroglutamyl-peptidase
MARVLLTSFEPFDGSGLNSSLEAMGAYLAGAPGEVAAAVLPVRYGADVRAVAAAVAEADPEVILHTGQGGGAGVIAVERLAVNVRTGPWSLRRVRRSDCPQRLIAPAAPPAYFATVPVEEIAAAILRAGLPARISNSAGIYMCNHVLYQSLHREASRPSPRRVGFLHLPCVEGQPGVRRQDRAFTPAELAEALAAAIEAILAADQRLQIGHCKLQNAN